MALNIDGRSFSASLLNKTTASLAGRVCPPNVFYPGNLVATGRCLYYDSGSATGELNAAGTSQTIQASMGLGYWNVAGTGNDTSASWYEGNIKTCADKGMRLPTLYETVRPDPGGAYKPTDASPTFASVSTGVPQSSASTYSWTASASTANTYDYWIWSGSNAGSTYYGYIHGIRCVVP